MPPLSAIIVIPARYGSTRFPGKPLLRQTGKYLIQHVVEQAQKVKLATHVVVATDDTRILEAVQAFGGRAVMTSATHPSGTDRIAEVMRMAEFSDAQIVVNVQGDEPEIDPELVNSLIDVLSKKPHADMATAGSWFGNWREVANPNMVKVVTDGEGFALYFSRAAIPHERDAAGEENRGEVGKSIYRKHLGIYAYRREALVKLAAAPVCELEQMEKLEQLRALHLGMKIHVTFSRHAVHGIDTPEDYAAFVARFTESARATA